jgi:hypothetical protein
MLAANTVTLAFYWRRTFTDVALLTGLDLWNFILDFFLIMTFCRLASCGYRYSRIHLCSHSESVGKEACLPPGYTPSDRKLRLGWGRKILPLVSVVAGDSRRGTRAVRVSCQRLHW